MVYMRILAGVPRGDGRPTTVGLSTTTFLAISVATSSETLERRPALSAVCRQRPTTRKPCCDRETARCRCRIR